MRLLVIGAGGMLGREIVRAAAAARHESIALTRLELDVTDPGAVSAAVADARPGAIVNCAAYTDVDGAEGDEPAARAVNAVGAGYVAERAACQGAALVHVSTDYIFDGAGTRPYLESDPPAPMSAYGRTKLAGEQAVAGAHPDAAIVRSSWLFGVGGRNFCQTMLRLAADRDEVTVVDDQVGCPTWTGHLAPALVELAARRAAGVWHVAGGGECSWYELAIEVFAQAGEPCRVKRGSSADLRRPAPRPASSVLRSERSDAPVLAPWREGVAGYLAARATAVLEGRA